jgi:formylglycine-generating enzyme required for sulfatase activity
MFKTLVKEQKNEFRLPTKNEWIYAAKGGLEEILYPWVDQM